MGFSVAVLLGILFLSTPPQQDALRITSVRCWSFHSSPSESWQTVLLAELPPGGKTRDLACRAASGLASFTRLTRRSRTEPLSASLLPPSSSCHSICSGCFSPDCRGCVFPS